MHKAHSISVIWIAVTYIALLRAFASGDDTDSCEDTSLLQITPVEAPSVRDFLHRPSPIDAPRPDWKGYHGQYPEKDTQQDKYVDGLLKGLRGGFAVEAGAADGETFSNSLFFETDRAWTGLLIEADPIAFAKLQKKNRQMYALNGCLSARGKAEYVKFTSSGLNGGISDEFGSSESSRVSVNAKEVDAACFPLHEMLENIGVTTVDYWSLDTEGSEPDILAKTDFGKVEVGVLGVEHNGNTIRAQDITNTLKAHGFIKILNTFQDSIFVNPSYFNKRGLPLPTSQE